MASHASPSDASLKNGGADTNNSNNNKDATLPSAVEFEPPLACVRRILKNSLPSSTNVGKDASAAFARACGIFIIYITACANDFAREHKRQTITANDVLAAMKELDFEEFTPEMVKFLENYRAMEKSKKDAKARAAAKKSAGSTAGGESFQAEDDNARKGMMSTPSGGSAAQGLTQHAAVHTDDDGEDDLDDGDDSAIKAGQKRSRDDDDDEEEDTKRTKSVPDESDGEQDDTDQETD